MINYNIFVNNEKGKVKEIKVKRVPLNLITIPYRKERERESMKIRPKQPGPGKKPATRPSWQCCLGICLSCFLSAFLLSMGWLQNEREALASRLAPSVLRLHILADSDQKADQEVKLEIRSLILDYLKGCLNTDAGKEETLACLREHRQDIEAMADRHLNQRGMDYHASLRFVNDYFPTRVYSGYVFPCGYYDAARITLGRGDGHNWWCVLYPQFCFTDTSCQPLSGEQAARFSRKLSQGDALTLEDHRPDIQIRFFLLPFLTGPDANAPAEEAGKDGPNPGQKQGP